MSDNKQPQHAPRNIFEVINQNIVDLSQDVVTLYEMVEKIYAALYPTMDSVDAPKADGAVQE